MRKKTSDTEENILPQETQEPESNEEIQRVLGLNKLDLMNESYATLIESNIILKGMEMAMAASTVSETTAILFTAILELRDALENTILWLENNHSESHDENTPL